MSLSPTNGKSLNKDEAQKYGDGKTFWKQCISKINASNVFETAHEQKICIDFSIFEKIFIHSKTLARRC